ncbi:MAG: hypothetical protein ACREQ5_08215 [Candidatus Dormibacteria bacterium]
MGLTRFLLRVAAARPHVLLVEVPGGTRVRLAVERELRQRGWPAAASPADADVLVVAGPLGPRLSPLADRVWQQVPAPRAYLNLLDPGTVPQRIDDAWGELASGGGPLTTISSPVVEPEHGGAHSAQHDMDGHGGQHDQGMDAHGGQHDMGMPGGLPMADRGADRDGLMLDQLHVPLGPLLPDWPAGLVVHTTLQGDVVQAARAEVLRADGALDDFWGESWRRSATGEAVTIGDAARRRAAAHLDSLARLLAVAGWSDATVRTRWLRDDVLGGAHVEQLTPLARRLARRLRGSRALRWLTDGVGVHSGGDVSARWLAWLVDIEQALPGSAGTGPISGGCQPAQDPAVLLAVLPELLEGAELGTARLIVASLDLNIAALGTAAAVPGG